jgi:hypothetical protein
LSPRDITNLLKRQPRFTGRDGFTPGTWPIEMPTGSSMSSDERGR